MSANYTIKEYVKYDLGISGAQNDVDIDRLIRSVTAYINLQIFGKPNETLEAIERTQVFDIFEVPRSQHLFLNHPPIISIDSVSIADEELASTDYYLYSDVGKIVLKYKPVSRQIVTVVYTGGFLIDWDNLDDEEQHTLPWDIEELARSLIIQRWNTKAQGGSLKSESIGSWSRTFNTVNEQKGGYLDNILSVYRDVTI
jgi:hypothetical protein